MTLLKRIKASPAVQSAWAFLACQNYLAILAVVLAVIAIRLPIDIRRIMQPSDADYSTHIYFALDMLHHRAVPAYTLAHSFWEVILIGLLWLSRGRIDFWQSAILLQVVSSIASALILYFWYGALPSRPNAWLRAFWAVTLVIVTPIIAPALLDGRYYFGYIGLANYHNPTVHMLRPFALVMFIYAMQVLEGRRQTWRRQTWRRCLFSALVIIAATYLKPNDTLVLLPALGVMALAWLVRRKPIDWWLLIFGLGLPAVAVLGAQYVITYLQAGPGNGIVWMPLAAAQSMSGYLPVKFFLSIFFPLAIALVFWKQARQDHTMILAWLGFAIGAAQYYLLAEQGIRLPDGNFLWGAQISLFILFAVTIRFLLKQPVSLKQLARPATWLPYTIYLPHIAAGIAYYIYCYVTPHYG